MRSAVADPRKAASLYWATATPSKKPGVAFRQSVSSSALPQQTDVAQGRFPIDLLALSDAREGLVK
jgi:hypothetical protein